MNVAPCNDMERFYTVIQLITGVNFVFILSNFLDKTINDLFNVDAHLESNNKRYANQWLLDSETVQTLTFQNNRGENNGEILNKLTTEYRKIAGIWTKGCNWLKKWNEKVSKRLGFQTLFLIGSIYCLCDLILMSYICTYPKEYLCEICLFALNLIFLVIISVVFIKILIGKVVHVTEDNIQYSFWFFALICIVGLALFGFQGAMLDYINPKELDSIFLWNKKFAIAFPFLPCTLGVVYIFIIELINKAVYRCLWIICSLCAYSPNRQLKKLMEVRNTFTQSDEGLQYQ